MNESSNFYSQYPSEIETRFNKEQQNYDNIPDYEIFGEFDFFGQREQIRGVNFMNSMSERKTYCTLVHHQ